MRPDEHRPDVRLVNAQLVETYWQVAATSSSSSRPQVRAEYGKALIDTLAATSACATARASAAAT